MEGLPQRTVGIALLAILLFGIAGGLIVLSGIIEKPVPVAQKTAAGTPLLTDAERQWVFDHRAITVCPDPEYPPFEFYDGSGRYAGISADYLRLISKKTGLVINDTRRADFNSCVELVRAEKLTILGAVFTSDLRKGYLNYTDPYYQPPLIIITRTSTVRQMTMEDLKGKTVVAVEGYTVHELLRQKYPTINLTVVPTIRDALRAVSLGSADAYIGEVATTSWYVENEGLTNLHIAGEFLPDDPDKFHLAIGVRSDEPELLEILNKGLAAVTPQEQEQISNRWITASLKPSGIDGQLLAAIAVGFGALLLAIVFIMVWNRSLQHAVGVKTQELNRELEDRVKAEDLLRDSEEKYRTILETIQDVYYRSDARGRLEMISPSGVKMLGYASSTEMIGLDIAEQMYCNPADREAFLNAMDANGFVLDYEVCLKRKDGSSQVVSTTSHFYFDAHGEIKGIEGIFRDITLRKRTEEEMVKKNVELRRAYEELSNAREELKHNYLDLSRSQQALEQARTKLSLLNTVALQDIQNAVFTLSGYFELQKKATNDETLKRYIGKQIVIVRGITESLQFIKNYQNLGLSPPRWQNVQQTFLMAISHRDFSHLSRDLRVKGLEIYADSLLEQVFFALAENVLVHAKTATTISLTYQETKEGLMIVFEDDGPGIAQPMKGKVFDRQGQSQGSMSLFLTREILSVTGISIRECGMPGKGARFEMLVPRDAYRFTDKNGSSHPSG